MFEMIAWMSVFCLAEYVPIKCFYELVTFNENVTAVEYRIRIGSLNE